MEAERTLGPSFWGQERISYELRRAVHLLENLDEASLDQLFEPAPKSSVLRQQMMDYRFCDPLRVMQQDRGPPLPRFNPPAARFDQTGQNNEGEDIPKGQRPRSWSDMGKPGSPGGQYLGDLLDKGYVFSNSK